MPQEFVLSGDVTMTAGGVVTIAADTVTLDMMADIATDTFLGRVTASTGTVEVLTNAQSKTALDLTGTNSGDQTAIADFTGTSAEFDTANTDGDFAFSAGAFHDGFSDFSAPEHNDWTLGSVAGFHALGIDDNTTGERLQLADTILQFGESGTSEYALTRVGTTGHLRISGGDAGNDGSNIRMFASADATQANDFQVCANSALEL